MSLERSIDRVHVRCLRVRLTVCSLLPLPLVPSPMHAFQRESRKRSGGRRETKATSNSGATGPPPTHPFPPSCPHLSSSTPAPACTAAAVGKEEFQASRRPRRTDRCVGRGPHPARPPLPPCVHPKRPSRTGKPNRTTHLRVGPRFTWPHMQ